MNKRYPTMDLVSNVPIHADLSLWELLALHGKTWIAERTADAEERRLNARTRIVEAYTETAEAEYAARVRLLAAKQTLAEALRPAPSPDTLEQLRSITAALAARQEASEERLTSLANRVQPSPQPAPSRLLPPAPPALEVHLTDRQIEMLAMRAVTRFAPLSQSAAEQAWATWQKEIKQRFPPYAADEIMRRATALRTLSG